MRFGRPWSAALLAAAALAPSGARANSSSEDVVVAAYAWPAKGGYVVVWRDSYSGSPTDLRGGEESERDPIPTPQNGTWTHHERLDGTEPGCRVLDPARRGAFADLRRCADGAAQLRAMREAAARGGIGDPAKFGLVALEEAPCEAKERPGGRYESAVALGDLLLEDGPTMEPSVELVRCIRGVDGDVLLVTGFLRAFEGDSGGARRSRLRRLDREVVRGPAPLRRAAQPQMERSRRCTSP
jgi:hypothetical protein